MQTRTSLLFSFIDRYSSLAISIIYSMVIARLLTPNELGVFSVTMVLLAFVSTIRDMGAGQYLVQEKELTTDRIRAVWAVQLGLGLGLACLVLLASYPVAEFYKEPRMRAIMLVVAFNYAINPFGSLTYAWLMREMQFEKVALMRFLSGLGGALVAVYLAWKDYGPISLAYGSVTTTLINALVAGYYRPPSFPWLPGTKEVRRVLTFGSQITFSMIVTTVASSAPEIILGKFQSLTAAGYFSRSNGLVQMIYRLFVDAVWSVCLPWFSQKNREKRDLSKPFLKATSYVTVFGWSFCFALIFLAQPIIRMLYGDQWDESVDLTRLLAVAMAFTVPSSLCLAVLLSIGEVTTIARVTVISTLQSIFFTAIGASFGLLWLGVFVILSAAISATLWLQVTAKLINITFREMLASFRTSMSVALLSASGPAATYLWYGAYPKEIALPVLTGAASSAVGFIFGIVLFNHPIRAEFMTLLSKLRSRA